MRKDMGRVVIERPRTGGFNTFKAKRHQRNQRISAINYDSANDDDLQDIDFSGRESVKKYHFERKSLSDLIGLIRRYLFSKVGQPWDNIWSEVCENLKGSHAVEHVRDHVKQMVAMIAPVSSYRNGFRGPLDAIKYGNQFYIDENGILQRQVKKQYVKTQYLRVDGHEFVKTEDETFWRIPKSDCNYRLWIKDGVEYVFLKSAWFKFTYKDVSECNFSCVYVGSTKENNIYLYESYDIFGVKHFHRVAENNLPTRKIRFGCKQLSHAELQTIGLRNFND